MPNSTENSNRPNNFRTAFEELTTEIRAVEDEALVAINLDVPSVVATVLGVNPKIRAFREDVVKHLPTFEVERFDALETYAMALGHAQTEYQIATEPPASVVELVAQVTKARSILLNDVETLISRGVLSENMLKNVNGGTGYKAFAFEVLALAGLYRHHWDTISTFTAVKTEELDEAEHAAETLTAAVGQREQSPAVLRQVVRDRQAAFTLLVRLYDEVRSAFFYLRRKQRDADTLVPSLYAGRAASKKSSQGSEEKPNADPSPAVVTPAISANAAAGGVSPDHAATAKPPVASTGPYA